VNHYNDDERDDACQTLHSKYLSLEEKKSSLEVKVPSRKIDETWSGTEQSAINNLIYNPPFLN